MIKTEAWVLYEGPENEPGKAGELIKEEFSFSDINEHEVLVEPIYGSWEANMSHAIVRNPVDICRLRNEKKAVVGNAGVIRVLKTGGAVEGFKEGDICITIGSGIEKFKYGHMRTAHAYDSPNSVGLLAKVSKFHKTQLIKVPDNDKFTLQQWAAFSLKYFTAWANWKVSHGAYRLMINEAENPNPYLFGWGGGVSFAMMELGQFFGYKPVMVASGDYRINLLNSKEITPIDRNKFANLSFDEKKYKADKDYREIYNQTEKEFLKLVNEITKGEKAAIFVDLIGSPVLRVTLKALGCPGVLTTAGWKEGMAESSLRAIECMNWHTHVHTHGGRYSDVVESIEFAQKHNWVPCLTDKEYEWDDIPQLASDFANGIDTYFPIYKINPL